MADEPTRSGSVSGAKKEGYLTKEGWKVKNWKKRWFVLGNATLSYYKTHVRLLASLDLGLALGLPRPEPVITHSPRAVRKA